MSIKTCLHPNCDAVLMRGRVACKHHWFAMPEDLRNRFGQARNQGPSATGALEVEAREFFESRIIGEHEIVYCRGRKCGADIVWMQGFKRNGDPFRVPVNANTVEADDADFDGSKHTPHWSTCPNAEDFRRA